MIVYLLLMIFSIGQVIRFNIYQQSYYFNTSSSAINSLSRSKTAITDYFKLAHVNKSLAEENRKLREALLENQKIDDSAEIMVRDSSGRKKYTYLTASVIQFTTHLQKQSNSCFLSKNVFACKNRLLQKEDMQKNVWKLASGTI